jgi:hypothetical protein
MVAAEIRLLLEGETALGLHCFQCRHTLEALIGQRLIGEWPEMLSGLQLERVGRQAEEMDALGDGDLLAGMPPGAIEHK